VQLFFLFFVLAKFLPKVYDPSINGERPLLGSFASAAIALSLFAGAFNMEILRSGIEAVPKTTIEACESLGFSRSQYFRLVILPLAFRICLPALNNNLVNLIKTTTLASAIATPELLYYAGQIYANNFATLEVMLFIWFIYVAIVGVLVAVMNWWERKLKIPGYGN
jgi:polar amino acid transport system permease protein